MPVHKLTLDGLQRVVCTYNSKKGTLVDKALLHKWTVLHKLEADVLVVGQDEHDIELIPGWCEWLLRVIGVSTVHGLN